VVGRVQRSKKRVGEVERVKRPDLERWKEGFKGWMNWRIRSEGR